MAYGTPANVRSHRRGGQRRRRRVAPWVSATLASVLVLVGLGVVYQQALARTCSGEASARIVASPTTVNLLGELATQWEADEPSTEDGTCARVEISAVDSAEVAERLAAGWDEDAEEPPDVWVPASTAWAQKAAASDVAEPLMPDLRPSIGRTPTVIAMPKPMAEALNWPDTELRPEADVRWESLLEEFGDSAEGNEGWAKFDHPEWGEFRFGMSDPARSTAGLLALTAILDADDNGETSDEELDNAFRLEQLTSVYHDTTEQLLTGLVEADDEGAEAALRHVSAFPALEQDVLEYNRGNPEVPLAAVYPSNGNIEADNPYLVLNADWVTDRERAVAEKFLTYVRGAEGSQLLQAEGFRGTNREPGEGFTQQNGLLAELDTLPRAVLVPESVALTIDQWTALTRPTNLLLAFDVSGSMNFLIEGTGEIRMTQAKQAATSTVELFGDDAQVGFWEFSTALDGANDYRSLVPIGPLEDVMEDGRTRRQHTLDAIANLVPVADTGLYNTIAAAHAAVLDNYDEDATNMVVVLTDGVDDTGGRPGLSEDELIEQLRDAPEDRPVHVVMVGFGEEQPDFEIMQRVSVETGSRAYRSAEGFDLEDVLRTAVFNRLS